MEQRNKAIQGRQLWGLRGRIGHRTSGITTSAVSDGLRDRFPTGGLILQSLILVS